MTRMFKDTIFVPLCLCVWLLITKQVHSCEDKDVELMVAVLEEVGDWVGLAGQLNINADNIKQECSPPAIARCYRREVVKASCNRLSNPYQVASDMADALVRQGNNRQAKALRNLKFAKNDEQVSTDNHKQGYEGMTSTDHHGSERIMSGTNNDKYLMTGVVGILFTVGVCILLPFLLKFLHPKSKNTSSDVGGTRSQSTTVRSQHINDGSQHVSPTYDVKLDINTDVGRVYIHLNSLDRDQLKQLFGELGLFHSTLNDKYSHSVQVYADDLIRAWILGRDGVLDSEEYPGGATMMNLKKALETFGHIGIARNI